MPIVDTRSELGEQIHNVMLEIDALELEPTEMYSLLCYLAGANVPAMRDGLRYLRDTRLQAEMRRVWKACPDVARWPTYTQHDRSCRACKEGK